MTTADSPNGNRDSDDARWRLDDDRPFELGSIDWSDDEQRPLVQPGTSRAMDLSLRWAKEPDPSTSVDDVEPALAESVDDVDLSMLEELLEQPVPDAPEFVPHREVYADPEPTPPVALVAVEPAPEPEPDRDAPEPAAGPEEPAVAFPDDDHDAQVAYSDWEAWRDSLTGRPPAGRWPPAPRPTGPEQLCRRSSARCDRPTR